MPTKRLPAQRNQPDFRPLAARPANANGVVLMYADEVTPSMERAIMETERRRAIQDAYNKEHGHYDQKLSVKAIGDGLETQHERRKQKDAPAPYEPR